MAQSEPQSFANHTRFVPAYHGGVLGILVLNLAWSGVRLFRGPSLDAAMALLVAIALLGLFLYARIFALTVQDRVIRLEMRLRLREVLPPELAARIPELSVGQLVALRFAGDAELPGLVREVLETGIRSRSEIKKKVRTWQADHLRA